MLMFLCCGGTAWVAGVGSGEVGWWTRLETAGDKQCLAGKAVVLRRQTHVKGGVAEATLDGPKVLGC